MKTKRTLLALLTIATISISASYVFNDIKPAVGDIAPEIVLNDPDGNEIKLSDLRGKVVLVDFWASWCRTCRIENNNFTKAYNEYKTKTFDIGEGFEIYSVSLDKDVNVWKKAIYNDRLSWKYHGSDFKKWDSPLVEAYNFKYLPFNVLIDKNGKIIAKGLFGNKLEQQLKAHLAE